MKEGQQRGSQAEWDQVWWVRHNRALGGADYMATATDMTGIRGDYPSVRGLGRGSPSH